MDSSILVDFSAGHTGPSNYLLYETKPFPLLKNIFFHTPFRPLVTPVTLSVSRNLISLNILWKCHLLYLFFCYLLLCSTGYLQGSSVLSCKLELPFISMLNNSVCVSICPYVCVSVYLCPCPCVCLSLTLCVCVCV